MADETAVLTVIESNTKAVGQLDAKIRNLEARLGNVEARSRNIVAKLGELETKIDRLLVCGTPRSKVRLKRDRGSLAMPSRERRLLTATLSGYPVPTYRP